MASLSGCGENPLETDRDSSGGKGRPWSRDALVLPKVIAPAAAQGATDGEQVGGSLTTPAHARMFQPLPNLRLAARFPPRADEGAGLAEGLGPHPRLVARKATALFFGQVASRSAGGPVGLDLRDAVRDLVLAQNLAPLAATLFRQGGALALERFGQEGQRLTSGVVIQDADGGGEIEASHPPNPGRPISQEHAPLGLGEPAANGFGAPAGTPFPGRNEVGDIRRRSLIPLRARAGRIGPAVREHGPDLDLARAGPPVLAAASPEFLAAPRRAGPGGAPAANVPGGGSEDRPLGLAPLARARPPLCATRCWIGRASISSPADARRSWRAACQPAPRPGTSSAPPRGE